MGCYGAGCQSGGSSTAQPQRPGASGSIQGSGNYGVAGCFGAGCQTGTNVPDSSSHYKPDNTGNYEHVTGSTGKLKSFLFWEIFLNFMRIGGSGSNNNQQGSYGPNGPDGQYSGNYEGSNCYGSNCSPGKI
jgi:hypothetical protein